MFDVAEIKRFTLEKLKFGYSVHISKDMIEQLRIEHRESYVDEYIASEVIHFFIDILSQKLCDDRKIIKGEPLNRWQAFKMALFPKWLLKKYPIKQKETILNFERRVLYPDHPPIPENAKVVVHEIIQEDFRIPYDIGPDDEIPKM